MPTSLTGFGVIPGQVLGVSTDTSLLFMSDLGFGSRGAEVMALQARLQAAGYFRGPVTGYYGLLTREAVRSFQRAHGVSTTGYFGPLTRSVINS
jgi:N-acetylmuramoyl-L-alanine amidase